MGDDSLFRSDHGGFFDEILFLILRMESFFKNLISFLSWFVSIKGSALSYILLSDNAHSFITSNNRHEMEKKKLCKLNQKKNYRDLKFCTHTPLGRI